MFAAIGVKKKNPLHSHCHTELNEFNEDVIDQVTRKTIQNKIIDIIKNPQIGRKSTIENRQRKKKKKNCVAESIINSAADISLCV